MSDENDHADYLAYEAERDNHEWAKLVHELDEANKECAELRAEVERLRAIETAARSLVNYDPDFVDIEAKRKALRAALAPPESGEKETR